MIVVLVIMGLVVGLASLRLVNMVGSWRERTQLDDIKQQFAHLPVQARQLDQAIVLPPPASVAAPPALTLPPGWVAHFDRHLQVHENGLCEGANIDLVHGAKHYALVVKPPFCAVTEQPVGTNQG